VTKRPFRVLFVCTANSSQSQMAEGWLRHLGGDRFIVRSAGTRPSFLHPLATRAMQEAGIEISAQRGKGVDAVASERFDLMITLCEEVHERGAPELRSVAAVEHHPVDDPTWFEDEDGPDLDAFRQLRDELRAFVEALVARMTS
jgi:protein-tyrosine-phosphatase